MVCKNIWTRKILCTKEIWHKHFPNCGCPLSVNSKSSQTSDLHLLVTHSLVFSQLSLCMDEFESLMSLATSMMEGRDPNTSTLLGIKSKFYFAPQFTSNRHEYVMFPRCFFFFVAGAVPLPAEPSYEQRLEQVRQFREDIERLRTLMASHFASQVASDCAVQ